METTTTTYDPIQEVGVVILDAEADQVRRVFKDESRPYSMTIEGMAEGRLLARMRLRDYVRFMSLGVRIYGLEHYTDATLHPDLDALDTLAGTVHVEVEVNDEPTLALSEMPGHHTIEALRHLGWKVTVADDGERTVLTSPIQHRLVLSEDTAQAAVGNMLGNWALQPGDADAIVAFLAERGHETALVERRLLPRPLLLWVDLETLGLDVPHTPIVEIACILTDAKLRELWRYETIIETSGLEYVARYAYPTYPLGETERTIWQMHTYSGLLADYRTTPDAWPTVAEVEALILGVLREYDIEPRKVHMAGGGIAQFDQPILKAQMPKLADEYLHYRPVDVSVIDTAVQAAASIGFTTPETRGTKHRAMPDIEHTLAKARSAWWLLGQLAAIPAMVDALRFADRLGVCNCYVGLGPEKGADTTDDCPIHHGTDSDLMRGRAHAALQRLGEVAPLTAINRGPIETWRDFTHPQQTIAERRGLVVANLGKCTCPATEVAPGRYESTSDQQGQNPACAQHGQCSCPTTLAWVEHSTPDMTSRGHWENRDVHCPIHGDMCLCPTFTTGEYHPDCPLHGNCHATRTGLFAESFSGVEGYVLRCDLQVLHDGDHHDPGDPANAVAPSTWGG